MQSSTPAERHRLALTAMLMLPSRPRTRSASTTKAISGLTCCTLHDSCLRFEHDVTGALARLGSHLPATALVTKDLHLHVKHQLLPAHSRFAMKDDILVYSLGTRRFNSSTKLSTILISVTLRVSWLLRTRKLSPPGRTSKKDVGEA